MAGHARASSAGAMGAEQMKVLVMQIFIPYLTYLHAENQ
jgi:hypothetical protein